MRKLGPFRIWRTIKATIVTAIAIITIIAAAAPLSLIAQPQKNNPQRGGSNAPANEVTVQGKMSVMTEPSAEEKQRRAIEDAKAFWKRPEWINVGLTVLLVFIGYFGVRAANKTLTSINRQVGLQIAEQRPWLFLIPPQGFTPPTNFSRLDWKICNLGKTTATLIEVQFRCVVSERPCPDQPDYGTTIPFHGVPIAPQGNVDAWTYVERPDVMAEKAALGTVLGSDVVSKIVSGVVTLRAYAAVAYLDGNIRRESRFCYYYATAFSEFRIDLTAPQAYHRCS